IEGRLALRVDELRNALDRPGDIGDRKRRALHFRDHLLRIRLPSDLESEQLGLPPQDRRRALGIRDGALGELAALLDRDGRRTQTRERIDEEKAEDAGGLDVSRLRDPPQLQGEVPETRRGDAAFVRVLLPPILDETLELPMLGR